MRRACRKPVGRISRTTRARTQHVVACAALLSLFGCAAPQPLRDALADGFTAEPVAGAGFVHTVLTRRGAGSAMPLHIYIEGDGTPWQLGRVPARDPTPRNALALRLAALDDHDVIYVGRPCYFGHAADPGCDVSQWTSGRYGNGIVESMAAVIRRLLGDGPQRPIILIGYSGGGSLATLIADRLDGVLAVLSIAANLDTDAWTRQHGYLPLSGSLNPANLKNTARQTLHVQVIGSDDTVVPEAVTLSYQEKHPELVVWPYPDSDHACCWEQRWPEIVARLYTYIDAN